MYQTLQDPASTNGHPHERQGLISQDESPRDVPDLENPSYHLSSEDNGTQNEPSNGLLQTLVGSELAPLRFLCSCAWMFHSPSPSPTGDYDKSAGDEMYHEVSKPKNRTVDTATVVKVIKYIYSLCLLAFCINIIMAGIFAAQTPISKSTHWSVAFSVMWLLIIWLGVLEGGQGCLVGLQPICQEAYEESHPISHQCTSMAHKGQNLNRFIVGRQFLVVLVVFAINMCCSIVKDAVIPGFSPVLVEVFVESGLSVMLITVMLGQLSAEVNATNCMLDFLNNPFVLVTTWLCLAIEASGLLHSVYLVQYIFAVFIRKDSTSDEGPKTATDNLLFWIRVLGSLFLLVFACVVTMSALLNDQTTMYEGKAASVAIFFGLVCFLGMLEAMQIALFAVVNLPRTDLDARPTARANCDLAFRGTNFQAFLIGRQICVTMCMFLLARITTTDVDTDAGDATVLGMGKGVQGFFNTGLPGALITTIVASLAWRIFASSFPIAFLANPLVSTTIRLCLLLEASGVFSAAWLLAKMLKQVVGLRLDEHYLGPLYKRSETIDTDEDDETLSETGSMTGYGSTATLH